MVTLYVESCAKKTKQINPTSSVTRWWGNAEGRGLFFILFFFLWLVASVTFKGIVIVLPVLIQ